MRAGSAVGDDRRQALGKLGEDLARAELQRRGYAIIARRYRTRCGEIDVIARHQGDIVFIEVKSREGSEFGGGAAAVTGWKQQRIARMATDFLARRGLVDSPCRFDVVTVDFVDGRHCVEVYTHAFEVS